MHKGTVKCAYAYMKASIERAYNKKVVHRIAKNQQKWNSSKRQKRA